MDVREHNRQAWDKQVEWENPWTVPVGSKEVAAARRGDLRIVLTPTKPVPDDWFPDLEGAEVLCLASGGGQQGPLLAAAGARVTVFDNSPGQLAQDRDVAEREGLELRTVEGDMADLSAFPDATFDLIVHPVSNVFVPEVRPVWREAFRVLRPGASLLAGFGNGVAYLFDFEKYEQGELEITHSLPYSDLERYSEEERRCRLEEGEPLEFGHVLEDQIGGQIEAGFTITGFYEDRYPEEENDPLSKVMPRFIATQATKPR